METAASLVASGMTVLKIARTVEIAPRAPLAMSVVGATAVY